MLPTPARNDWSVRSGLRRPLRRRMRRRKSRSVKSGSSGSGPIAANTERLGGQIEHERVRSAKRLPENRRKVGHEGAEVHVHDLECLPATERQQLLGDVRRPRAGGPHLLDVGSGDVSRGQRPEGEVTEAEDALQRALDVVPEHRQLAGVGDRILAQVQG